MKKLLLIAGLAVVIAPLAACEDDYYVRPAGYAGYGVAYASGPAAVGYDGYYDDYYGPFYDGYWGGDGFFYYQSGPGRTYARDNNHHFRHDQIDGFHPVHGGFHGPAGGRDRRP